MEHDEQERRERGRSGTRLASFALLVATACGGGTGAATVSIDAQRVVPARPGAFANLASRERFGLGALAGAPGAGTVSGAAADLAWTAPDGWTELAPSAMRAASFAIDAQTECSLTTLVGNGGGLGPNLDRWRGQIGLPPMTPDELAALPRLPMAGVEAPWVELEGDYAGMGGSSRADFALLGAVAELGDRTLFAKLVGPRETVARERDAFFAFCASIAIGGER